MLVFMVSLVYMALLNKLVVNLIGIYANNLLPLAINDLQIVTYIITLQDRFVRRFVGISLYGIIIYNFNNNNNIYLKSNIQCI